MAMHTFLDLGLELRRGLGVGLDPLDSAVLSVSSAGVSSVLVVVIIVPDKLMSSWFSRQEQEVCSCFLTFR